MYVTELRFGNRFRIRTLGVLFFSEERSLGVLYFLISGFRVYIKIEMSKEEED